VISRREESQSTSLFNEEVAEMIRKKLLKIGLVGAGILAITSFIGTDLLADCNPPQDPPNNLVTGKSVDPTTIYVKGAGFPDETTVTLTVTGIGNPNVESFPMDVALVMDKSGSMVGQQMEDAKLAAIYFCSLLGTDFDQSSLVTFSTAGSLDQYLTPDHNLTIAAIDTIVTGGLTAMGEGIFLAQSELTSSRHLPESDPIMILLSDGDNNSGREPLVEAFFAKQAGTKIYCIGLGTGVNELLLKGISSDPDSEYYFYAPTSQDLDSIYGGIHERISNIAAKNIIATEILAPDLEYVPNTFSIDPISISGDSVIWNLGELKIDESWSVAFNISANDTGHLPVDDYPNAEVNYTDCLGDPESVAFPQAYIDVLPPAVGIEEEEKIRDFNTVDLKVSPNPFLSIPIIQFSLTQGSKVSLEVYNLAGGLVRTLMNEMKPSGNYTVNWDRRDDLGREASSGIYLLRLRTGEQTSIQKMILLH
jgi:uncharacterized protein YegL